MKLSAKDAKNLALKVNIPLTEHLKENLEELMTVVNEYIQYSAESGHFMAVVPLAPHVDKLYAGEASSLLLALDTELAKAGYRTSDFDTQSNVVKIYWETA